MRLEQNRGRVLRLEKNRGRALWQGRTWEVTAWRVAHLGSCHSGKYPWKVAAWENAFGKEQLGSGAYVVKE